MDKLEIQNVSILCKISAWSINVLNPKILVIGTEYEQILSLLMVEFENSIIEILKESNLSKELLKRKHYDLIIANGDLSSEDLGWIFNLLKLGGTLLFVKKEESPLSKVLIQRIGFIVSVFTNSGGEFHDENFIYICYRPQVNEKILNNHSLFQAASYDNYVSNYCEDIEFLRNWLGDSNQVLEVGVGTGRLALDFCKGRKVYYGLDNSASMLHILRKKLRNTNLPIQLIHQPMQSLELDRRFDAIIFPFRVLPYLKSEDEIISVLIRTRSHLLNQDSRILLNMLNFSE